MYARIARLPPRPPLAPAILSRSLALTERLGQSFFVEEDGRPPIGPVVIFFVLHERRGDRQVDHVSHLGIDGAARGQLRIFLREPFGEEIAQLVRCLGRGELPIGADKVVLALQLNALADEFAPGVVIVDANAIVIRREPPTFERAVLLMIERKARSK